jgi:hypothetical protein
MNPEQRNELLRLIGSAIGIGICLLVLISWRIPASGTELGADIRVVPTPPGEMTITPAGAALDAPALKPGGEASGRLAVSNITGRPLHVELRTLPSTTALDGVLSFTFTSGGVEVAAGTAGQLRSFAGPGFDLAPAQSRKIDVTAHLDAGAKSEGRIVDVSLEFAARVGS